MIQKWTENVEFDYDFIFGWCMAHGYIRKFGSWVRFWIYTIHMHETNYNFTKNFCIWLKNFCSDCLLVDAFLVHTIRRCGKYIKNKFVGTKIRNCRDYYQQFLLLIWFEGKLAYVDWIVRDCYRCLLISRFSNNHKCLVYVHLLCKLVNWMVLM